MAATDEKAIRGELRAERAELAEAIGELRGATNRVKRVTSKLLAKEAVGEGAAVALGFVKAGGLGTAVRLIRRRKR